jgi:hypothetical protein
MALYMALVEAVSPRAMPGLRVANSLAMRKIAATGTPVLRST